MFNFEAAKIRYILQKEFNSQNFIFTCNLNKEDIMANKMTTFELGFFMKILK